MQMLVPQALLLGPAAGKCPPHPGGEAWTLLLAAAGFAGLGADSKLVAAGSLSRRDK